MKFTIIINTKNQNETLERAINSCLKQTYSNLEIIVSDLNIKKNLTIKNRFNKNKKITFLDLKEKFLKPTQNQLYAIKKALDISRGKYILLLDGDDYFDKKKITYLNYQINKEKKNFLMDTPIIFYESKNKEIQVEVEIARRRADAAENELLQHRKATYVKMMDRIVV
jgi:glycosyltransferase involved in cell wall biosynthesis